jgi:hypothetical protein
MIVRRVILLLLILCGGFLGLAQAQQPIDLDRSIFAWDWAPGANGAAPETFRVWCGVMSGNYTLTSEVAYPAQWLPVRSVVPTVGLYYCVVVAVNSYGPSGPSNEVVMDAGSAPDAPTVLRLELK